MRTNDLGLLRSRTRLDHWGPAFFALIGLAGCGGMSVDEGSPSTAGGTGGTGTGGTGAGASGGTGGAAGSNAGYGGTGSGGSGGVVVLPDPAGECVTDYDCSLPLVFKCVTYTSRDNCFTGKACQTPDDECQTNADCDGWMSCMPGDDWVRRCKVQGCAIGRPFLVLGAARTARTAARNDWSARVAESAAKPANDELRAALANHWLLAARMEHASVAAFARFSLELLAVAAPPDLVLESARAMQDETIHAELCFGLASRYGGGWVGPGPLSPESALDEISLESAVRNALLEGCIGETLAAAEAQAACEHAQDPVVRDILERIAADETRHAALAFRFVAWALERDARLAELVRDTMREHLTVASETCAGVKLEAALLEAGVLPPRHRADVRRYAYETIVLRALRALLDEPQPTAQRAVASC